MERIYSTGQIIIQEGDRDKTIYLLKSGKLGVLKGERLIAEIHTPGASFGEMSAILDQPRSTTVKALTHCIVEAYSGGIDAMAAHQPHIMKTMLKTLAKHLSDTTDRLYSYMADQDEHENSASEAYLISFRNVTIIEDRIMQRVISDSSDNDLVVALLGAIPKVRHKFFSNMSRRKARMIREDMSIAVRLCTQKAIAIAQQRILEIINELIITESMGNGAFSR